MQTENKIYNPLISVITPAYNRTGCLMNVYNSLKRQSSYNFEWIIVDDGSTDNSSEVISEIINKNAHSADARSTFSILCFYKQNGGKHTAVNLGVNQAHGKLVIILDSDDELSDDCIEFIEKTYKSIANKNDIAGICGLMCHRNGTGIGNGAHNIKDGIDCDEITIRFVWHVTGDLCEVFRTDILKKFPFPVYEGERFCPEQLVWFRIARKYKLHCVRHVMYLRDYLHGGLTDNITRVRRNSPMATCLTYKEMLYYNIPLMKKIKAAINFWRFYDSKIFCKQLNLDSRWYLFYFPGRIFRFIDFVRQINAKAI